MKASVTQQKKKNGRCSWSEFRVLCINQHTAWGRLSAPPPPSGFSQIAKKRACSATKFAIAVQQFDTFSIKNDDPMTPKVTPPGHIKWPDLKLHFLKFESLSKTHQRSKLFETHRVQNEHRIIYDLHISDFLYRWPQVMSFSWPSHYKSAVKMKYL